MIMLNGRIRLEEFRNIAIALKKKDPVKSQETRGSQGPELSSGHDPSSAHSPSNFASLLTND
jgi:hypothetical protein